jgi:hypothetical protein
MKMLCLEIKEDVVMSTGDTNSDSGDSELANPMD